MSTATRFVGCQDAAEILGISTRRVQQLSLEGRIGRKVGRNYIYELSELRRFKKLDRPAGRPPQN